MAVGNYSWGDRNPDRLEVYDRRTSAYDPAALHWVAAQMDAGRPEFVTDNGESILGVLMEEPPNSSHADDWERRERLEFAIRLELDRLPDDDAWVIYMLYFVRLSLRFVARCMHIPKTSMARQRDQILTRLRKALVEYPVIQEMIEPTPTPKSVIPIGMPSLSAVQNWEEGSVWAFRALQELRAPNFEPTLDELMAEAKDLFPSTPSLGWWADLLGSALRESNGIVDPMELMTLLSNKQHDYGYDNIAAFGHQGIVIRCNDKLARLRNLKSKEVPAVEPVADTYYDLCGYAVLAGMLEWGLFMLTQKPQ